METTSLAVRRALSVLLLSSTLGLPGCDSSTPPGSTPIGVGPGNPGSGGGSALINALPIALPDVAVVQAGSSNNPLNVLGNDRDADGDPLLITTVSQVFSLPPAQSSTISLAPDSKSLRYTPPTGFVGTQTLSYTISDGRGGLANALAVITVSPLPIPPAAVPDTFTRLVDSAASPLNVLANDIDGAGGGLQLLTASSVATIPVGHAGTVNVSNGALQYRPEAGFTGVETLSYTLRDANGATASAVVIITVLPIAAPPVALPDVVLLGAGSSGDVDVLANDVDLAGGGLSLSAVSALASLPPGSEGSFSIVGNQLRYTPTAPGFVGTQTASYTVTDANGTIGTGLLTLVITPLAPAVPPLALPDTVTLASGSTAATLAVLGNDIDVAGGGLSISDSAVLLGLPDATGVTVTTDGSTLQLALPPGYAGVLTLSYTATDSNGSTATAPVLVTVLPAALPLPPPIPLPDLAVLAQDSAATDIDVLANDIDPAGTGLSLDVASVLASLPVASHSATVVGDQLRFTPAAGFAGVVTVGYTARDSNGGTADGLLTVTVTPALPVALPAAVGDVGNLVVTLLAGSTGGFDVLANDIDPAGGGLTLQSVSFQNPLLVTIGSLLGIVGNQVQLTVPLLGVITGVLPVEYTAVDSLGRTVTGLLNITISL